MLGTPPDLLISIPAFASTCLLFAIWSSDPSSIRSKAGDYGFNPSKVGIMGFSAGGHLATAVSALAPEKQIEKPDFSALIYQMTTLGAENQKWLEKSLFHHKTTSEEKKQYELVGNVTKLTPSAFLLHAYDDELVPIEESLLYAKALTAIGQDVEVLFLLMVGMDSVPVDLMTVRLNGWAYWRTGLNGSSIVIAGLPWFVFHEQRIAWTLFQSVER